jgi:hypothetical protein
LESKEPPRVPSSEPENLSLVRTEPRAAWCGCGDSVGPLLMFLIVCQLSGPTFSAFFGLLWVKPG